MTTDIDQEQLTRNISEIRKRITSLETKYGRPAGSVKLLAVGKTFPAARIESAYSPTQQAFGENYVDEAVEKIAALKHLDIEWHYIGPIQSNKTRKIAEHFSWVQTLASEKHARRLSEQRPDNLPPLNCCIQINISNEDSKSGIRLEQLPDFAQYMQNLPNLRLRGIMGIPAKQDNIALQRQVFGQLANAYCGLIDQGYALDTLSMGMTGDMGAAIAEGSTMVRIGTAIFGHRQPKTT